MDAQMTPKERLLLIHITKSLISLKAGMAIIASDITNPETKVGAEKSAAEAGEEINTILNLMREVWN